MRISIEPSQDAGTLLWIGSRTLTEFRDIYRYCEEHAAQLAHRETLEGALARPAGQVSRVVIARPDRRPMSAQRVETLRSQYERASWIELRGVMCEGDRSGGVARQDRCDWRSWEQTIPAWMNGVNSTTECADGRASVVAVVAASASASEPLMDLIISCGATAIWSRQPEPARVRGIDAVWWDDSAASQADESTWRNRIESWGDLSHGCQHLWLANAPTLDGRDHAINAGVERVISKPFAIDCLIETLGTRAPIVGGVRETGQRRIAA